MSDVQTLKRIRCWWDEEDRGEMVLEINEEYLNFSIGDVTYGVELDDMTTALDDLMDEESQ